ncbi:MAG: protein translocase subunit SecF [Proteobacteria bacterium]|nr:protein translocase subunit SecF [Pseudomonadota bacterium]
MKLEDRKTIDFLGKRRIALVISLILAAVGIIAAISIPLGKANLGTDFSGGVSTQFRFEKPVVVEDVRSLLDAGGFGEADIQEISGSKKLLIRVKKIEGDMGAVSKNIGKIFAASMSDNPYVVDSTTEVGPTVGKKLQRDAFWAIVISLFGIFFYIGWRFEFRFGIAAVAATFHDVLAVLGILFVLNHEINLLVITALLTVAGYSINDSVVVFDRIRENLRRRGKSKEELVPLINRSVNEMLRRTVVTSGTTLLVLVALFVLGGEVIHEFALTLILGVLIGTYSSIFVASPLLLLWKGTTGKLVKFEE